MNDSEWESSHDPLTMLSAIRDHVTVEQLRLFAQACCRSVLDLIGEEESRTIVEMALRALDLSTNNELQEAARLARLIPSSQVLNYHWPNRKKLVQHYLALAAQATILPDAYDSARETALRTAYAVEVAESAGLWPAYTRHDPRPAAERRNPLTESMRQAHWLRCIVGNPFRPIQLESCWLYHNNETVLKLAQVIQSNHDFHDLPILGDALEEAGCGDDTILMHCHSEGEHVRGCWILDMIVCGAESEI